MTVSKAIALWKVNSGVVPIEKQLDHNYKSVVLTQFVSSLERQVSNQKMLGFLAMEEHCAAEMKVKRVEKKSVIDYYEGL